MMIVSQKKESLCQVGGGGKREQGGLGVVMNGKGFLVLLVWWSENFTCSITRTQKLVFSPLPFAPHKTKAKEEYTWARPVIHAPINGGKAKQSSGKKKEHNITIVFPTV